MGKEGANRYKRQMSAVSIAFLFSCPAFSTTACGDAQVNTGEKIDTEPDTHRLLR